MTAAVSEVRASLSSAAVKSALAAVLLVAGSCGLSGGVERVVQAPSTKRLAAASAARKVRDIIRSFQGEASAA